MDRYNKLRREKIGEYHRQDGALTLFQVANAKTKNHEENKLLDLEIRRGRTHPDAWNNALGQLFSTWDSKVVRQFCCDTIRYWFVSMIWLKDRSFAVARTISSVSRRNKKSITQSEQNFITQYRGGGITRTTRQETLSVEHTSSKGKWATFRQHRLEICLVDKHDNYGGALVCAQNHSPTVSKILRMEVRSPNVTKLLSEKTPNRPQWNVASCSSVYEASSRNLSSPEGRHVMIKNARECVRLPRGRHDFAMTLVFRGSYIACLNVFHLYPQKPLTRRLSTDLFSAELS